MSEQSTAAQEVLRQGWQQALESNVRVVGDAMGNWGDMLATRVRLRMVDGEESYAALPGLKLVDGDVEVTCNTDAFDLWHKVLDEIPDLPEEDIRNLYLASAASWVELTYLSFAAKREREFEDKKDIVAHAIGRAARIAGQFGNRDDIADCAKTLETEHGMSGISEIATGLTDEAVQEINKIRYSLGTAMYALDFSQDKICDIRATFRRNLGTEMDNYEITLLSFLEAFTDPEPYAHLQSQHAQIKRFAFPHFLFAGTSPMGYEEEGGK